MTFELIQEKKNEQNQEQQQQQKQADLSTKLNVQNTNQNMDTSKRILQKANLEKERLINLMKKHIYSPKNTNNLKQTFGQALEDAKLELKKIEEETQSQKEEIEQIIKRKELVALEVQEKIERIYDPDFSD